MTQLVAIYDLDRTLTARPTWSLFLLQAARRRAPWRLALAPVVLAAMGGHALGLLDRKTLKQVMQRLLLGRRVPAGAMNRLSDRFAATVALRPGAATQVAADRAAGYRLVLASAANDFYAAAIARRLGIDDVIATRTRRDSAGAVLARIEGENCYGAAKLAAVERWLAAAGIARAGAYVRVYSDHASDAPLLGWADEAFAINPHSPLATLARARGWATLDWRAAAAA